MSDSLFVDLYSYRQRENKEPLEDWLTECLAATMRALPHKQLAVLLGWLSGCDDQKVSQIASEQKIDVQTQRTTVNHGRPDMVVTIDHVPWMVFENKVAHCLAEQEEQDGRKWTQLNRYADWLNKEIQTHTFSDPVNRPLPSIVFITHLTPPPKDFTDIDCYYGFNRCSKNWGEVARKIMTLAEGLGENHIAYVLAKAQLIFLKEKNMDGEFPSNAAFAATRLYSAHSAQMAHLLKQMLKKVKQVIAHNEREYSEYSGGDFEKISLRTYLKPNSDRSNVNDYVEVGLIFPETNFWFEICKDMESQPFVKGDQFYVRFSSSTKNRIDGITAGPEGFYKVSGSFFALRSVNDPELSSDAQNRGMEILQWVEERSEDLQSFLTQTGFAREK